LTHRSLQLVKSLQHGA